MSLNQDEDTSAGDANMISGSPLSGVISDLQRLLAGDIDIIAGVRAVAGQRSRLPEGVGNILLAFAAFESETEHFPEERARQFYAPEFLARLDAERADYLEAYGDEILEECRKVLRELTRSEG